MEEEDLVYRLRKRAEIRRQIPNRKSVQDGEPDRIADLLDEAAKELESLPRAKTERQWREEGFTFEEIKAYSVIGLLLGDEEDTCPTCGK